MSVLRRPTRVIARDELSRIARLDRATLEVVRAGFIAHAQGRVRMPPVMHLDIPERGAEVDVKTAFAPDLPVFAVKISTGVFGNAKLGMPSLGGLMVAVDSNDGTVRAVLLDEGYLTDVRTALAGALASEALARPDARIAGILGSGVQARLQARALTLVRPISQFLLWGRNSERASLCAQELAEQTGIPVRVLALEQVVRHADILVTTTSATVPFVKAEWLTPGVHVTAMGSDAPGKNELEPACLARAQRVVVDDADQCLRLGELRSGVAAGLLPGEASWTRLGTLLQLAQLPARGPADITICDLTGLGIQDTAIAAAVVDALQG